MHTITIEYYAQLREQAGQARETVQTAATTLAALYQELKQRHGFKLDTSELRVAVNARFSDWAAAPASGDLVVFIPPVAGG